ncbi:DNA mismatch repair protein MsH2, putative [Entamoeba invadens IP1]|uniref:DNA mismatch repair protein MsH2, putative n=1 Tax=Entamoeba invadens IP1 TaxID=370355 RepID=A0A0A1UF49_ENTIV|nr:DNA mismatch repair protein MsH2, putative [Entamoeba invadens IP1]ELP92583.1 DNA mismatch repair protein MsH2, putative [Entamoeba invadens IP1]|eukprot:XP_004259354.1 DNA mismatch repair protein MsH2, putative [Entamoeba invadens IP1]
MEEVPQDESDTMTLSPEIISGLHITSETKELSLFSLLNKTKTANGKKLLENYILHPLTNKTQINFRLDLVQSFVDNSPARLRIMEEGLVLIPDITRITKTIEKITLENVVILYNVIQSTKKICEFLDDIKGTQIGLQITFPLKKCLADLVNYEELVNTLIDLDAAHNGVYRIRDDFDETLRDIREKLDEIDKLFTAAQLQTASDLGVKADKVKLVEYNSNTVLRVAKGIEKTVKADSRFKVLQSLKGECKFTFKTLQELNVKKAELVKKQDKVSQTFVDEIVKVVVGYKSSFEEISSVVSLIDVIQSFATTAVNSEESYVRPVITEDAGNIILMKARHPLAETLSSSGFVENDVYINRETSRFQIVTGPNMGGKSTYLRMIGMCVIMAQIGMYVPCDSAEVAICDNVMCRIGAGDDIVQGVSTFMAEMKDSAQILRKATSKTLVLIDELGRGTSTFDGFGIAWGISEYLINEIGCFCVFATHFHEVTALEKRNAGVKNVHVVASIVNRQLVLKYKVNDGSTDQSLAVYVAEWADFPKEVVDEAKKKAHDLELETDSKKKLETFNEKMPNREVIYDNVTQQVVIEGKRIIKEFNVALRQTEPDKIDQLRAKYKAMICTNDFLKLLDRVSH